MITAEEFFRQKLKELQPFKEVVTLSQEMITAEQGMRWAHEFKQLHLHNVVGRSEQLVCGSCNRELDDMDKQVGLCYECGYELATAK